MLKQESVPGFQTREVVPVLTGSPRHHDGQGNRHPRIACAFSVQRGKHMLRKGGCAQSCRDRCLHSSPPICEAKILMQIMSLQIVLVLLLLHLQLRAHGRGHVCQGAIVTYDLSLESLTVKCPPGRAKGEQG